MSIIVLQLILVFMNILNKTVADVTCRNPIQIGELRVRKSKLCVDIADYSGRGNVLANLCDGFDDQQIIWCEDGTMRNNEAANNCLTPKADGNVVSTSCKVFPEIPDYQKWRFGRTSYFVDEGGIEQKATEIINVASGLCLDVADYDGIGNILTYRCEDLDDQYFYFRDRGKLIRHGRLQNKRSGLCLDVADYTGGFGKNVQIYDCENELDQYFNFYENGELVNKKSRLCADVSGFAGTGNILMWSCGSTTDQMWTQPAQFCNGDYCAFRNKKSGYCMDVSGYEALRDANVLAYGCDGAPDQSFKWIEKKWITPTATWTKVGCNQNGAVSLELSNSYQYSETISESIAVEISSTIEAGVEFFSAALSTSVSSTLATEWENSYSQTRTVKFSCDKYDSGNKFTHGCMWQVKLTTNPSESQDDVFHWSPLDVKCTSTNKAPSCPPFTKCTDDECTMCEEMPGSKQKKQLVNSKRNSLRGNK